MTTTGHFDQTLSGIRWIGAARIVVQVVTWALTLLSVRLLTQHDYGVVSMSGLITVLAGLVLDGGLFVTFVQRKDVTEAAMGNAVTALLGAAMVLTLLVQLVAHPAAVFFSEPQLELVLRIASLQFPLSALAVVPNALLIRQMRFKELAVLQSIASVTQGIVTVALAYFGCGLWSLVIGSLWGLAVRVAMFHFVARPPRIAANNLGSLRPFLSQSGYLIAQRLLWFWVQEADTLLIGRLLGSAPLGTYTIAKTLSNTPLERAAEIVNQVSLPAFASAQDDRAAWRNGYGRMVEIAALTAIPLFWGLATVAPTALPLVLGERWAGAVMPFVLLCCILPLRTIFALSDAAVLAAGRMDIAFKNVATWAAVMSPMLFAGAYLHGLAGAAAAWAVGFPLVFIVFVMRITRAFDMRAAIILKPLLRPALAMAAGAVLATLFAKFMAGLPAVLVIAGQIVIGAGVYVAGLWLIDRAGLRLVVGLVRDLLGRRR